MNSGVIAASSRITIRKLPNALARKSAFGDAGDTRYASSTWLCSSRAHVWLSATTEAKRKAVQIKPPAMRRDSSAVGSKAKLKITTTSSAKNSMELSASFERHSRRKSFASVVPIVMLHSPALELSSRAQRGTCCSTGEEQVPRSARDDK